MRTIVHISDLHFGRIDAALLDPLRSAIAGLAPHLVVVSGDLTQRARAEQFREARDYLATLARPQLVVPGNHDVPLYNIFKRFLGPLDNYRRYISQELEPAFVDDEIAVVGVNTARSLTFKGGRINEEQLERVRAKLCNIDERVVKMIVTHHPFDVPDTIDHEHIVGRARKAIRTLADCGADLLLAGHAHMSHAGETTARYRVEGFAALVVQAGTATSTRGRGEANAFNALHVEGSRVRVDRHAWNPQARSFVRTSSEGFEHTASGWKRGNVAD